MNQVMEGLVGLEPGTTGNVIPVLATALPTISSDSLTYTFTLREGVKFHDGTDFDCDAVKFNYDRWLNIPPDYSKLEYTYYIDSALKPVVDSVACNSPTEFAITLKAPNSAFLLTQTLSPFFFASPKALTDGDASNPDFAKNTYAQGGPTAMTGTGPFKFKSWVPGDSVTLEKNADYWDTDHRRPSRRHRLQGHRRLDGDAQCPPGWQHRLRPDPLADRRRHGRRGPEPAGHRPRRLVQPHQPGHAEPDQKPFDNPKIRQAVAYAVNKQALIDTFYGGSEGAVAADNWMPPGTATTKALNLPTYDPEKAKALIAESGVTDLSFEFWYPSDVARPYMPDPKGEFQSILSDLEAVGFKPTPKTSTWRPDYLSAEAAGKYPMWLIGWTCDWAGPDNFLNTAFFGYRARSDGTTGPNEEYGYKNDSMWQAMSQRHDHERSCAGDDLLAAGPGLPGR